MFLKTQNERLMNRYHGIGIKGWKRRAERFNA